MRPRVSVISALVAAFLGGLGVAPQARAAATRVLKPLHPVHATNGIECDVCHAAATTSTSARDTLLPREETCSQCHDVKDTAQCAMCHVGTPAGYGARTVVAQNFPHATHVGQGMSCVTCHGPTATSEPVLPAKSTCRDCHVTASQQTDCRLCHAAGEPLVPASHGPQFLELHALQASWDQGRCADCHTQTDCQECHKGDNVRPRSHPLNYFFDHALDARSKEISCSTCHRSDFCSDCHAAQRVLPTNHSLSTWVLPDGGRHAEEGRFDMETCAACHAAGTSAPTCARCHGR